MKMKSLVLLAMALGCGLIAMLGVQQLISANSINSEMVPVLVAKQEINAGIELAEPAVVFEPRARVNVPEGAITQKEQYARRAGKAKFFPGEIILISKLGDPGQFGASAQIEKGKRVVTVPVNMTSANSGMVRPGDRVDILVTYKLARMGGAPLSKTKTVLEFIEVFALDQTREFVASPDASRSGKVENLSVIVTPEQAHLLMLATSKGTLQMALRNSSDDTAVKMADVDESFFDRDDTRDVAERGEAKPEPAPTPAPVAAPAAVVVNIPTPAPVAVVEDDEEEEPEPEKKVWQIQIYEGEHSRLVDIDLPSEKPSKESTKSGKTVKGKPGKTSVKGPATAATSPAASPANELPTTPKTTVTTNGPTPVQPGSDFSAWLSSTVSDSLSNLAPKRRKPGSSPKSTPSTPAAPASTGETAPSGTASTTERPADSTEASKPTPPVTRGNGQAESPRPEARLAQ